MKVKELIAKLQEFDGELEARTRDYEEWTIGIFKISEGYQDIYQAGKGGFETIKILIIE